MPIRSEQVSVTPFFGVVAAIVFLEESVTVRQFVGAALIIGGIFLFTEDDLDE
ncbi:EamA family transporter [Streptomyces sp. NPDC020875]|uniref:EamA family transporter n=1 Tax=Streptomyces sp. NPDC020875 TaxID=3154898 RepID=UPI003407E914